MLSLIDRWLGAKGLWRTNSSITELMLLSELRWACRKNGRLCQRETSITFNSLKFVEFGTLARKRSALEESPVVEMY